jgi:beta-galactosidase
LTTVDQLAAGRASWTLHPTGCNAKVTAFFNGRGVGRLWLPSAEQPPMRGGHNNALYLPAPWFQPRDNLVALLIEAIDLHDAAVLERVVAQQQPNFVP